ncbi:peroxiredoxin-like family protein [Paenibacillus hexagrammi]|uniref:thioredoxin-dependent peroxiredoxin n=1 Tax=Paenibacillus hexagrammi TaxID=2908839 RepID=A0ABY3SPS2_9BACL|nr:peroxiredoxin-like family protein [Paenibacillus sp. YPD9-1]UJF36052.1 AhpC/TSA family protein [Paenibacillus sp. YPD9-1]
MQVKEQLEQAKAGFMAKVPDAAQSNIFLHIKEQQQSGIEFGLKQGMHAPPFTLSNAMGQPVTLYDELAKGPVVLTFYRGSWCPFCNIQLRAFQQTLPDIQKLGATLIAVTPQHPDHSLSQQEKEQLSFQVLSDPNGLVADSYKLLFELPGYLQSTFTDILKRDLAAFNNSDRWLLPVPATLIIDQGGKIRSAHVNPDFMQRVDPLEILTELRELLPSSTEQSSVE